MGQAVKTCLYSLMSTAILGCLLIVFGTSTTLPGPDSKETLLDTQGELVSMAHGLYRTDTFVGVLKSQALRVTESSFVDARENFVKLLRNARDAG